MRFPVFFSFAAVVSGAQVETGSQVSRTVTAGKLEVLTEDGQPELSLKYLTPHLTPPGKPLFRLPPTFFDPPKSPVGWDPTPSDVSHPAIQHPLSCTRLKLK